MKPSLFTARHKGFTLIELMIVIAIIAILATIAIPSYQNYTKKAAVSELLQAAAPYKGDIELCVYSTGKTADCDGGKNGISNNLTSAKGYVKSISVKSGAITVNGNNSLDGVQFTMQASGDSSTGVTWTTTCDANNTQLFPAGFCSAKGK
ncbi:prepilin-type cleavage/methylation N-terminal domain protein [Haemophilus pittmaniae HK 85]|jgi:type IV pilin subunit protein|uniref:Fimbrial subunit n=2 Tax=Haemophilus pittmaniae TaxID=249188 RepID=A0A377IW44_9PAST|nr:prepilin peptidase-dependent pilin [Haemophilus pittmaniae]EGV07372.1 prepilin-type cleavage/methylation N-terminal domain protein [Haemophilus pittmaniae HK 85]MBS6027212.1 prepilin peptidase-dependent pilin [Haemophilus pittmaniae]SNV56716.1 fimbrial subunit [Haemophilus pittmaniae]STO92319.1 fimbrial subunit [Haemophilus pittmaniae]